MPKIIDGKCEICKEDILVKGRVVKKGDAIPFHTSWKVTDHAMTVTSEYFFHCDECSKKMPSLDPQALTEIFEQWKKRTGWKPVPDEEIQQVKTYLKLTQ